MPFFFLGSFDGAYILTVCTFSVLSLILKFRKLLGWENSPTPFFVETFVISEPELPCWETVSKLMMTLVILLLFGDIMLLSKECWMGGHGTWAPVRLLFACYSDEPFHTRNLSPLINTCQSEIMSAWFASQGGLDKTQWWMRKHLGKSALLCKYEHHCYLILPESNVLWLNSLIAVFQFDSSNFIIV